MKIRNCKCKAGESMLFFLWRMAMRITHHVLLARLCIQTKLRVNEISFLWKKYHLYNRQTKTSIQYYYLVIQLLLFFLGWIRIIWLLVVIEIITEHFFVKSSLLAVGSVYFHVYVIQAELIYVQVQT